MEPLIKTKVIATLGPATSEKEQIIKLIKSGVRIIRINSSHETPEIHKERIKLIREAGKELNLHIPVLLDLQGPKIRVGNLKEDKELIDGELIKLAPGMEQEDPEIIPVDYSGIVNDVEPDDMILLDDGKLEIQVKSKTQTVITAKIINGGILKKRKGLNIPGTTASISAVTERDVDFIKFAIENQVDFIALSFVRTREDIVKAKKYINEFGGDIPVIAKIEKPQAVDNMNSIIVASDGVMVARGDLGIEISPEKVPIVQKRIITEANAQRKEVITATQMLETMIVQPTPTRAETSDIANAIMDGTDAVMLSGETAVGKFPYKAVGMMRAISENVENSSLYNSNRFIKPKEIYDMDSQALATAVIRMLSEVDTKAIVAFTKTGFTARILSKAKPSVPVITIAEDEKLCRRLNLLWGVFPLLFDCNMNFSEEELKGLDECLIQKTFLNVGDKIILTGGQFYLIPGRTNFLRLHQIGSTVTRRRD